MTEQLNALIAASKSNSLAFATVLAFIDAHYQHQPTAFKNGDAYNEPTQNQGSAKVFTLAKMNGLSKEDTLFLFAEHYQAVLADPDGTDHQNIRQFMMQVGRGLFLKGRLWW